MVRDYSPHTCSTRYNDVRISRLMFSVPERCRSVEMASGLESWWMYTLVHNGLWLSTIERKRRETQDTLMRSP